MSATVPDCYPIRCTVDDGQPAALIQQVLARSRRNDRRDHGTADVDPRHRAILAYGDVARTCRVACVKWVWLCRAADVSRGERLTQELPCAPCHKVPGLNTGVYWFRRRDGPDRCMPSSSRLVNPLDKSKRQRLQLAGGRLRPPFPQQLADELCCGLYVRN